MKNPELKAYFEIPALTGFNDAVEIIGFVQGTSRNWLPLGKFPLPIYPINGLNFVKTSDLKKFIDDPSTKFNFGKSATIAEVKIRGRGRPKKIESKGRDENLILNR